jgi:hypothetical protein
MCPHAIKPVGSTHMLGCEWANRNAQTLLFAHGRFKRRFRRFRIAAQATNPAGAASASRKNPALYTAIEDAPAEPSSTEANLSPQTSKRMPISPNTLRKPELLAPAGGWPQLHAAIENGADAVYFGVSTLNARARACNFEPEELPKVMAYLHERGASGSLALNVLIFDEELLQVAQLAQQVSRIYSFISCTTVLVNSISDVLIKTIPNVLNIVGCCCWSGCCHSSRSRRG